MKYQKIILGSLLFFYSILSFGQPKTLSVGTAGPGSIAFVWVSSLSSVLEQTQSPVRIKVSAGIYDNEAMRIMEDNKPGIDGSFVSGSSLVNAGLGRPPFQAGALTNIRALFPLGQAPVGIAVRADSGIKTLKDLNGKRISAGPAGTGNDSFARAFLKQVVPNVAVTHVPLSFQQFAPALQDKRIDALYTLGAPPYPAIIEASALTDVSFVTVSDAEMQEWLKDNPQHHKMVVPKGTYPKQTDNLVTLGHVSHLIVSGSLDQNTAYTITKAWLDAGFRKSLLEASTSWSWAFSGFESGLYWQDLIALKVKLHPGAIRAYKEANIKIPAELN